MAAFSKVVPHTEILDPIRCPVSQYMTVQTFISDYELISVKFGIQKSTILALIKKIVYENLNKNVSLELAFISVCVMQKLLTQTIKLSLASVFIKV